MNKKYNKYMFLNRQLKKQAQLKRQIKKMILIYFPVICSIDILLNALDYVHRACVTLKKSSNDKSECRRLRMTGE